MQQAGILFVFSLCALCRGQTIYQRVRDCLSKEFAMVCLKEEALKTLNETIMSDQPLTLYDSIDIVRDPSYQVNETEVDLPENATLRSEKLNDLLYEKLDEFVASRTIKLNLNSVFEGRKKKDKGMMMLMGGMAAAGMMAKMYMGKIAFLAGAAFIIAKMALFLSAIMLLKKMTGGGGGGGETQHVVYTSSSQGDYGHSHGGGGGGGGYARSWNRILNGMNGVDDPQNIAYKGYAAEDNSYSV